MADNKDDDSFEDADFEDLDPIEDEDDLADDSWDDEDSTGDLVDSEEDSEEAAVAAPKNKTFVQKNFMLIVGGVVVVFGGLIAMSLMGGGSAPAPVADGDLTPGSDIVELSDQSEMPPMPAPINATQEPAPEDNALTPLPTPQDLQNAELSELTIEEVPAAPAGKTTPQGEAPFNFEADPADKNADGNISAPERMNQEFARRTETIPEAPADPAGVIAPTLKDAKEEAPAEKTALPAPVLADSAPSPDTSGLTEQIKAQDEQIKSLEAKLADADAEAKKSQAAAEKSAQDSLKAKDTEIAALNKKISDMEKKLRDAEKQAATQPMPLVEEAPEPVVLNEAPPEKAPEPTPVAEAPKPAPVVKAKPVQTAKAPAAPKWELKGAQPGKAMLESKVTGDIRSVVVGDKVDGLGKITAIARENGHWTVRGTSGTVTR